MEEVAWCAGAVGDRPRVTHPVLALLAQQVHDRTSVSGRPALMSQVPALVGARTRDPRTGWVLVATCARHALAANPPERVRRVAHRLARRADRRVASFARYLPPAHGPAGPVGAALLAVGPAVAVARLGDLALALRCVLAVAGPAGSPARDRALADVLASGVAAVRALAPAPAPGCERVLSPV